MLAQLAHVIIRSTSGSQDTPGDNGSTTTPTNKKKSQKAKIFGTLSIKKAIAKAKHPNIYDLIDDFANVVGPTFFHGIRDQADYKDCILTYYYCFSLIFCGFN